MNQRALAGTGYACTTVKHAGRNIDAYVPQIVQRRIPDGQLAGRLPACLFQLKRALHIIARQRA